MVREPRDKALETIAQSGMLLVLVSMVDNMPYVLAEASVMGIPLLIYDVGGVTEMIDPKLHADVICGSPKVIPRCPTPTSPGLCTCHLYLPIRKCDASTLWYHA